MFKFSEELAFIKIQIEKRNELLIFNFYKDLTEGNVAP